MSSVEKTFAFLGRHFGPPRLALLLAAWILALGAWGTIARTVLPIEHRLEWEIPLELRAPLFAKFDSGWYLSIIEWGYGPPPRPGQPSSHAFFPLYPWTAKILHHTFAIEGFHSGMLVAYVCLFLAMPLFLREGRERRGETGAWRSVVFLLLFPTSFFLASMYAESMFFLFALLAFRDTRAGKTGRAVLWGILLGLTRPTALAVAPALFLAALETPAGEAARDPRRWSRALLIGAAPFVTVWAWILGDGIAHGEPGLFFRSEAGWRRGAGSLAGAAAYFQKFSEYVSRAGWKTEPMYLLDYAAALLFVGFAIRLLWKRRWSDAAWAAGALALPISTGLSAGMPRYLFSVYPVLYEMDALFSNRPRGRVIWWVASGALLLFAAARFVNALGVS
ncbi:MAG: mannosyltransferase family protein [Acidobacteriota bacterium]